MSATKNPKAKEVTNGTVFEVNNRRNTSFEPGIYAKTNTGKVVGPYFTSEAASAAASVFGG